MNLPNSNTWQKIIDVGFATNIRESGVIASSTLWTMIEVNWKSPLKGELVTLTHQRDNFGPRIFMLKNTFTTQGKNTLWSSLYIWVLIIMSYCATSEALAVPSWHFLLLEPYYYIVHVSNQFTCWGDFSQNLKTSVSCGCVYVGVSWILT